MGVGVVENLSPTSVAQHNLAKIISLAVMNWAAPKVGAKLELAFNKSASGLAHKY